MGVSLRTMPGPEREQREAEIAGKWADASPHLDERARRIWLGTEARQLGHGGIKFVAQATGAAIETVRSGIAGLGKDPGEQEGGRVRRPGGGRKKAEDKDPELPAALDALLDDDKSEAGDPMTPRLRWTSKSLVKLSGELGEQGHEASPAMVRRLMYQAGWRLQSGSKSLAKSPPHPDRNPQFGYISESAAEFAAAGQPVVSVDAKKTGPGP
jgi:Rhodopirellula transposase DDE domain